MQAGEALGYDLTNLDVIVLEHNSYMRGLLRGVLREFGVAAIRDTASPEDAFDWFNQAGADLILADWAPGLDGMAFLDRVRKSPDSRNPYVAVIVVTAYSEYAHVIEARDRGMTEFLAKPITATMIYERIRSVIDGSRPFVQADCFFGPDRRSSSRRSEPDQRSAPERRLSSLEHGATERRAGTDRRRGSERRQNTDRREK